MKTLGMFRRRTHRSPSSSRRTRLEELSKSLEPDHNDVEPPSDVDVLVAAPLLPKTDVLWRSAHKLLLPPDDNSLAM